MPEITIKILHPDGLHARSAARLVETARRFTSLLAIHCGDRTADLRSLLGVLALGVTQGTEVTLRAEGADAGEALAALQRLIAENFEVAS